MTNVFSENGTPYPQSQLGWDKMYLENGYTLSGLSKLARIDEGSISQYIRCLRIPRKKNLEKMEKAMFQAAQKPRLKFHQSYGYATEEQIKRLEQIGLGPEHDSILKEIEKQSSSNGKYIR